ncbi:MAG: hypothetical protein ACTSXJ_06050 [Candidatus Baldrarchaeia archaeon]
MKKKIIAIAGLLLAAVAIVGLLFSQTAHKPHVEEIPLSEEEIESIITLYIIDDSDEEITMVADTPPKPVSYPPVNITRVGFGTDGKYLYIKIEVLGEIPTKKDDPVTKITYCILMDTDENGTSGWCGYDACVGLYITWTPLGDYSVDTTLTYNIPTIDDEEQAFDLADRTTCEYKGGPGKNYVVLRVPMDLLGLKSGQKVVMDVHAEAESSEYHHYSFDALRSEQYNYHGLGNYFWHSIQITIP